MVSYQKLVLMYGEYIITCRLIIHDLIFFFNLIFKWLHANNMGVIISPMYHTSIIYIYIGQIPSTPRNILLVPALGI